ncbi:unnamed protein product [Leuciscus chuanchicus]
MDETAVWFDMVSPSSVDTRGAKSVALKTTGHEKSHLTIVLAGKADSTKLKPYIVFKGAIREVKTMQQQISSAVIATSVNGWMNDALTAEWLKSVVGKFNFTQRLQAWDSYRCHISAANKEELKCGYNITTAVIPGGCTKYIQALDVMWNQPFKASLHDAYDQWMAGDADKEHTAGGRDSLAPLDGRRSIRSDSRAGRTGAKHLRRRKMKRTLYEEPGLNNSKIKHVEDLPADLMTRVVSGGD